jgi:MarR family transcriptional repressor of emrRAB
MQDERTLNLLGAFALGLADDIRATTEAGAHHAANAPAAIVSIGNSPGETIETLSRILDLSHSATVRAVDRLEADGLVERRPGADARATALFLTRGGRRRFVRILAARRRVLEDALAALGADDRATLDRLLCKMLGSASRDRSQADHVCRLCDESVCPADTCPVEATVR